MNPLSVRAIFAWPRIRTALLVATIVFVPMSFGWKTSKFGLYVRLVELSLFAVFVFGLLERWPRRLPSWLARWALQVVAIGVAMPFATAVIYWLSTETGAPAFFHDKDRMIGYSALSAMGVFIAPWAALIALVRQKDAIARHQALEFNLARSELERQATDARLRLLQAQVAPHFLFNTLANIQALVDTGSSQASAVLRSLIAYLRAAVPRLHEPTTTLGQEVDLVRAYLELMHMRMPDRLQFALHVDDSARSLECPPMTLLTLVENAVRHGIDPSEEGGRIDIEVRHVGERCIIRVADTGLGLNPSTTGLGTGLTTLRERLALVFGAAAELRVTERAPHGVIAEVSIPARGGE
jgi:signal transduction histidine kinase